MSQKQSLGWVLLVNFLFPFHVPLFHSWPPSNEIKLFQESKIGLAVGKLRTHETKAISDLSKEIVRQWKAAVDKAKAAQSGGAHNPSAGESPCILLSLPCSDFPTAKKSPIVAKKAGQKN